MSGPAAIGIDAGSTTFKAVLVDRQGRILASFLEPADPRLEEQAARALEALQAPPGTPVGATGYGRRRIPAARTLTEITCHARGAFSRTGEPGILVDVGGQDTKVVRVGPGGAVLDFAIGSRTRQEKPSSWPPPARSGLRPRWYTTSTRRNPRPT